MHYIPGLRLRVPDHVEQLGIDVSEIGEFAYDYVKSPAEAVGHELRPMNRAPVL